MMKYIIIGAVLVLIIGGFFAVQMMRGPDLSRYMFLKEPRIVVKPDTQVIEVPFEVSSEGLGSVFGVLFKTYFKTPGTPKGKDMPAPAARYENLIDMTLPPEQRAEQYANIVWKGTAALPVPENVAELAPSTGREGLVPRLGRWRYGEVAEILHVGPYEAEPPTVQRLMGFIEAEGYEIAGLHEEEYLRGPGMPFTKPENYHTILRYPVRKKSE